MKSVSIEGSKTRHDQFLGNVEDNFHPLNIGEDFCCAKISLDLLLLRNINSGIL